jgi:hypothetical protein
MKFLGKLQIYFALFFAVVGLWNCQPESQNHECGPINCDIAGGPIYYSEPNAVDYISPVFNQVNNSEFLAMRIERAHDTVAEQITLEKFNYVDGTHQIILSNQFMIDNNISLCEFNWSANGWIVFHDCNSNQIYKIQDNGANLQQLSFDGISFYPNFNYDQTKIFFSNYSGTYSQYFGILMDINTNLCLDTIHDSDFIGAYGYTTSISNNRIICSQHDNLVKVIDENGLVLLNEFSPITNISNFTNYINYRNIGANTDEVIFNCSYIGICKLNLTSHQATLIKSSCNNRFVSGLTVSPDGNKIVYQLDKYDADSDNSCHVKIKSEIHIMNIDGSNDQILNLP